MAHGLQCIAFLSTITLVMSYKSSTTENGPCLAVIHSESAVIPATAWTQCSQLPGDSAHRWRKDHWGCVAQHPYATNTECERFTNVRDLSFVQEAQYSTDPVAAAKAATRAATKAATEALQTTTRKDIACGSAFTKVLFNHTNITSTSHATIWLQRWKCVCTACWSATPAASGKQKGMVDSSCTVPAACSFTEGNSKFEKAAVYYQFRASPVTDVTGSNRAATFTKLFNLWEEHQGQRLSDIKASATKATKEGKKSREHNRERSEVKMLGSGLEQQALASSRQGQDGEACPQGTECAYGLDNRLGTADDCPYQCCSCNIVAGGSTPFTTESQTLKKGSAYVKTCKTDGTNNDAYCTDFAYPSGQSCKRLDYTEMEAELGVGVTFESKIQAAISGIPECSADGWDYKKLPVKQYGSKGSSGIPQKGTNVQAINSFNVRFSQRDKPLYVRLGDQYGSKFKAFRAVMQVLICQDEVRSQVFAQAAGTAQDHSRISQGWCCSEPAACDASCDEEIPGDTSEPGPGWFKKCIETKWNHCKGCSQCAKRSCSVSHSDLDYQMRKAVGEVRKSASIKAMSCGCSNGTPDLKACYEASDRKSEICSKCNVGYMLCGKKCIKPPRPDTHACSATCEAHCEKSTAAWSKRCSWKSGVCKGCNQCSSLASADNCGCPTKKLQE